MNITIVCSIVAKNSGSKPGDSAGFVVHIVAHKKANSGLGRGVPVGQECGAVLTLHLLYLPVLVDHGEGDGVESHGVGRVHLQGKALDLLGHSTRHLLGLNYKEHAIWGESSKFLVPEKKFGIKLNRKNF